MALCEVCKVDVAPGDVFKLVEYPKVTYFCSVEHLREWQRGEREAKVMVEQLVAPPAIEVPEEKEQIGDEEEVDELSCPSCGFVAKSKGGLAAHKRAKGH